MGRGRRTGTRNGDTDTGRGYGDEDGDRGRGMGPWKWGSGMGTRGGETGQRTALWGGAADWGRATRDAATQPFSALPPEIRRWPFKRGPAPSLPFRHKPRPLPLHGCMYRNGSEGKLRPPDRKWAGPPRL